jgi:hypothetical protein
MPWWNHIEQIFRACHGVGWMIQRFRSTSHVSLNESENESENTTGRLPNTLPERFGKL